MLGREILKLLPANPSTIVAYFPLKDEANLQPLLEELLARGWTLFLPRFERGTMVFRQAKTLADLTPGEFKIPEPPIDAPMLEPSALAYALIPARAYTLKGLRLGRGNGGYDIWIRKQRAANPHTKIWGVCLECQLVNDIPMEAHDERVDAVLTARGLMC